MITTTNEPAGCIVCLNCLNNGRALGKWITAKQAAAEIDAGRITYAEQGEPATYPNTETTFTRCRKCGGDEWEMVDHENTTARYLNACTFYENAEQLNELSENGRLERLYSLASWLDCGGYMTLDELQKYDEDYFYGEYSTNTAFAEEYAESTGDLDAIPEHLQHLIDMDQYARDLMHSYHEQDGYYWRSDC
jgi:antirestriction protein